MPPNVFFPYDALEVVPEAEHGCYMGKWEIFDSEFLHLV